LLDRFDEERPGHGGVTQNFGETTTLLRSHELSPGNTLRVRATTQPSPVCRFRTYPNTIARFLERDGPAAAFFENFQIGAHLLGPVAGNPAADGKYS
jgi:hypothetical protein